MTSIAYKQYCNISYMGGSYVCSPIKGPMSTNQTPGVIENKNRGITHSKNGQPEKFASSDSTNTFSMGRKQYNEITRGSNVQVSGNHNNKFISPVSSSMRIAMKKNIALGKGTQNNSNNAFSYKSDNINDVRQAMRRARSSGYVVPAKARGILNPPEPIIVDEPDVPDDESDDESVATPVVDNSPPTIVIIGPNPYNVVANSFPTFSDPGAYAHDYPNGIISSSRIQVSGQVNMAVPGQYIITYGVSDDAGNSTSVYRIVNVLPQPDTTAPVITLNGDAIVNIPQNSSTMYNDPGATAQDDKDGNLTTSIVYSGDIVNMSVPGQYNITYTVTDSAGNSATATRIVNVTPVVQLTPTERFFILIDADGDELINISELTTALNVLGLSQILAQIPFMMAAFSNGTNTLTLSEFINLVAFGKSNYPAEFDLDSFMAANYPDSSIKLIPINDTTPNVHNDANLSSNLSSNLVSKISNKSPSVKVSAFMPRHLRNRVDCNLNCDGLATTVDDDVILNRCSIKHHIGESEVLINLECLDEISYVKVIPDAEHGNRLTFNNNLTYVRQYGVPVGLFSLRDIPIEHPLTILNYGKENIIYIVGDKTKKFIRLVSGVRYEFYYGNIGLYVNGDFDTMSFYCYHHGYMGGRNILRYSEDVCYKVKESENNTTLLPLPPPEAPPTPTNYVLPYTMYNLTPYEFDYTAGTDINIPVNTSNHPFKSFILNTHLPAGVHMNPETGELYGTIKMLMIPGYYQYTVTASTANNSQSKKYILGLSLRDTSTNNQNNGDDDGMGGDDGKGGDDGTGGYDGPPPPEGGPISYYS